MITHTTALCRDRSSLPDRKSVMKNIEFGYNLENRLYSFSDGKFLTASKEKQPNIGTDFEYRLSEFFNSREGISGTSTKPQVSIGAGTHFELRQNEFCLQNRQNSAIPASRPAFSGTGAGFECLLTDLLAGRIEKLQVIPADYPSVGAGSHFEARLKE